MGTQLKHPAGNFCWFELGSSDQNAAKKFYTGLFGWSFNDSPLPPEMGGVYTMFLKGDKEVCALYQLGPQQEGVPPHWMPYVMVESVDAAAKKVADLGGTVIVSPSDVMDYGRLAVFTDPTGATISIWEAKTHFGADVVGEAGTVCWNELATRDTAKAGKFYAALFGWSLKESTTGMPYTEFGNKGQMVGGMMAMDGPQWENVPPNWGTYFAVDDCDATVEKAEGLGGSAIVAPTDIPNVGRFSVIRDPQGAVFAVISLSARN
jgi:hypothetical protein